MISREHPLPLTRQCRLLNLSRSGIYYNPVPVSNRDRNLMCLMDEIHLEYPFMGSRGIKNELWNKSYKVGRSHIRTLMRKMGIEAIYKKPRLSEQHPDHTIYPYLLRGLSITEANTVWAADITYIPMAKGFCYLVAIMDWASRKVLSWRLSNTLDPSFCTEALEEAISRYGTPQIFNTDQGSQLPLTHLPEFSRLTTSGSAWTDGAAGWTTSSSRGSGRASNMKTYISRRTAQLPRQELNLQSTLIDTIKGGAIRGLTT